MRNKIIVILGILLLSCLIAFFYVLLNNPYKTEKIKVLDCQFTYNDYYFDNWSLRDSFVKPRMTTAFGKQFAEKEVGICLYDNYFKTFNSKYKTELLKLFKNNKEIIITEKNFEIEEDFKNRTGINKPKYPIEFNQYYLE
jgi:hypothetical protein